MTSRKIFAVMAALALLAISSISNAGIVDPAMSWADIGGGLGIMTIAPGGADSFVFPENHLIDVYVNDSGGNPVEILASAIWLEEPGVVWCPGGEIADSSTYAPDPGHTTFSGTPRGGVALGYDCSTISMNVIAVGNEIQDLALAVNSPDLNGSGGADVADFAVFGSAFNTDNHCANFNESTTSPICDVADFAIFASFFNISNCP